MTDKKTSQLDFTSAINGSELVAVVRDGTSYQTSTLNIANVLNSTNYVQIGGYANHGESAYSIAIGYDANTPGSGNPIAIGGYSVAQFQALALGYRAIADGSSSISIGAFTYADGNRCIAIGTASEANDGYCIAIGANAYARSYGAMAVGFRATVNAECDYAIAIGYRAKIGANGQHSVAVGAFSEAYGRSGVAIGYEAYTYVNGVAIGYRAGVSEGYGVAIGLNAHVMFYAGVAIGAASRAGYLCTAIGYNSYAVSNRTTAIGAYARSYGQNVVSIGAQTYATGQNAIALGGAHANYAGSVCMGRGAEDAAMGSFVVRGVYNGSNYEPTEHRQKFSAFTTANSKAIATLDVNAENLSISQIEGSAAGNSNILSFVNPATENATLSESWDEDGQILTISLGCDADGDLDPTKNTLNQIVALFPADGFTATCDAPGTSFVSDTSNVGFAGGADDGTITAVMTADGLSPNPSVHNVPAIPNGSVATMSCRITGFQQDFLNGSGDAATFTMNPTLLYRTNGGVYTLATTPTFTMENHTDGASDWPVPTLSSGMGNMLSLTVINNIATNVQWLAHVRFDSSF